MTLRIKPLRLFAVGLLALLLPAPILAGNADKPNIVLVLMDNFGYGELGVYGGGILRGAATPRIDALAAEGMRLTKFNVEAQCTPSRAALLTGRYADRVGVPGVIRTKPEDSWGYFKPGGPTMADQLKKAG